MVKINEKELFKKLVTDAVKEGLGLLLENKPEPYGYFNWPSLSFFKNGIPSLSESLAFSGPPDYKSVFKGYKPLSPVGEISFSLIFTI